jgi:uncharacterized membrane protein
VAAPVFLSFVHLFVAVLWVGGMLFMSLVLAPSAAAIDPPQRARLMAAISKRFTIAALSSAVLLLVTGLVLSPSSMLLDAGSPYGRLLFIKHVLFTIMMIVGVVISFVVAPRMRRQAPAGDGPPGPGFGKAQAQIKVLSIVNTTLGIAVLVLVALLQA